MAFDEQGQKVLLFGGGADDTYDNDTSSGGRVAKTWTKEGRS